MLWTERVEGQQLIEHDLIGPYCWHDSLTAAWGRQEYPPYPRQKILKLPN